MVTLHEVITFLVSMQISIINFHSLHDALPISDGGSVLMRRRVEGTLRRPADLARAGLIAPERRADAERVARRSGDRKSTRLNSSHLVISYTVFCFIKISISSLQTHNVNRCGRS